MTAPTPEQLRAQAIDYEQRRLDSIEASDTDGFLTQHAYEVLAAEKWLCRWEWVPDVGRFGHQSAISGAESVDGFGHQRVIGVFCADS